MDKIALKSAGINYDEGVNRFSGHAELYEKYLRRFLEDTGFQTLAAQVANQEYEQAFRTVHTLKGMVGNLSLDALFERLKRYTEMLRNGQDLPGAVRELPELMEAYTLTVQVIKAQV